ncbi:helix-turn-helix domain-containing protein [Sphingomonas asaccharolytica]|uniref:helix-turn-helix domain-containing protein n=1 Tax=Sphingomonas asaccharolytica TaxID=40681 RepID=UPI00082DBD2E|nr:helix-turn-helix domain-containing protein [Sphingomonas asaccharolytica]
MVVDVSHVGASLFGGRFATSDLPECDRHEAWCSRSPSTVGRLYETRPHEPFDVATDLVMLGPLKIHFSTISGQSFERTRAMAAADGVDDLVVNVRFRGGAVGDMNGAALDALGESTLLTDMAQPQHHVSEASSTAYFHVPRALAERYLPSVRSLHGLAIPPSTAALLREHLQQIWRHADRLPVDLGARLAGTVMDLLAVAVAQERGGRATPAAVAGAAMTRARAEIEARLGSATLTVATLCRALGMSRSALYRLFEDEGGVHAYVTRRRLESVAAALSESTERDRIADIAERWGFCDAAYLGRLFRERFGMTPSDYRAFSRSRTATRSSETPRAA